MRLRRATFVNFRLLRNLTLEFPTDEAKRVAVVRAANESGKTTVFHGLQWALYGDSSLPDGRVGYRLHPIDWDVSLSSRVPISVQVDFEQTAARRTRDGQLLETTTAYRIIRSTYDLVQGTSWHPGPTLPKVFRLTASGSVPIEPPEAWLRTEIPSDLREVFFTDGDRALSFIEAGVAASTKQRRVRDAIKALLDLDVIEGAHRRVKETVSRVNRRAKSVISHRLITQTVDELAELETEVTRLRRAIEDADQQFSVLDERYVEIERRIEEHLKQGNREDLTRQLNLTTKAIAHLDEDLATARRQHSNLFRTLSLSRDLVWPVISTSLSTLSAMRDEGKIPNSTIPVLEERLRTSNCICGESLAGHEPGASRRRDHIRSLIAEAKSADLLQSIITDLYYASSALSIDRVLPQDQWQTQYTDIAEVRDQLEVRRDDLGRELKSIEARIDSIPDVDLQGLQDTKRNYREQRDRFNADTVRYRVDLENMLKARQACRQRYNELLKKQQKGAGILAELDVAQDIRSVLWQTYQRLTTEELQKVSDRMNAVFLRMIGADPAQGAIVRRAYITDQFDIVVEGPRARTLNPDRDLNGASRRALTLAFILALVRVSDVEAPSVIDTPLGMMSGFVKTSVLERLIEESSQLILFLTPAEIKDCEGILDRQAASVVTLTNSAHYPTILVNDPQAEVHEILKCSCNHNQECNRCSRRSNRWMRRSNRDNAALSQLLRQP